ncbi:hypothetical protein D3C84_261020 [compost metagenome]
MAMAVCTGYLHIYVGAVPLQQVGQFCIRANMWNLTKWDNFNSLPWPTRGGLSVAGSSNSQLSKPLAYRKSPVTKL